MPASRVYKQFIMNNQNDQGPKLPSNDSGHKYILPFILILIRDKLRRSTKCLFKSAARDLGFRMNLKTYGNFSNVNKQNLSKFTTKTLTQWRHTTEKF